MQQKDMDKIMKKADLSSYISNLPNIAAVFGSCLYIFNTIRNKEIDYERVSVMLLDEYRGGRLGTISLERPVM